MPVLLLSYGDPQAKDMLRRAIEARYGLRPPVLDSLKLTFKGRTRVKVGPVKTWVPVEIEAFFQFPTAMRWDFNVKPLGLSVQKGIEAFDGKNYRSVRGGKSPVVIDDEAQINAMQRRLWATASILLTPLSNQFVKLEFKGNNCITAINTQLDDPADLYLRANNTLDYVQVSSIDPDGKSRNFILRLSEEQKTLNELILPKQINALWDDEPYFEIEPIEAESNPEIPSTTFTLEKE